MVKAGFLLAAYLLWFSPSGNHENMTMNNHKKNAQTRVIAHRGAWKNTNLPQNSIAALKAAITMNCYGSEMDVHMTSDGFIVVNHDNDFKGVVIQNSTLEEVRKNKLSNGEELPLLSDFLNVMKKEKRTKLIVEIKPSIRGKEWAMQTTRKVLDETAKYKMAEKVIYISFDPDICMEIRRLLPKAAIQYLNGDKTPAGIKEMNLSGIDYHFSVFKNHPEYLADSRTLGIRTNAWTVNDQETMQWLISHKIDFITTNEPELLLKLLKEGK